MTQLESLALDDGRELEDLSPEEIARVMVRVQRLRRQRVHSLEGLTVALAQAKKDATVAHARAFLAHQGPQEERTQTAKLAAAEAVFLADVAKGKMDAHRAGMDVLHDDWDTCRSIGANSRAQRNAIEGIGGLPGRTPCVQGTDILKRLDQSIAVRAGQAPQEPQQVRHYLPVEIHPFPDCSPGRRLVGLKGQ